MRLTRVHVDLPLAPGAELALPEGAAAHLVRVLRLGVGDACVLFNGDGCDYPARVVEAGKRNVRVAVGAATPVRRESPLRITLLQGIVRADKMDLILQKATELGVTQVHPLAAQRSEIKLDPARAAKRLAHWRNVVVAACEQCGRAELPEVTEPAPLPAGLAGLPPGGLRLTLDPDGAASLSSLPVTAAQPVFLAVGPEGGWSPGDLEQLCGAGFEGLRLGPRILRAETAGLAAIAALQGRLGDLA